MIVSLYHNPAALDLSQNYAFWGSFSVGGASSATPPASCTASVPGSVTGQHHVFSQSSTFLDRATVSGLGGYLPFSRSVSADGRQITLSASSPALANRDLRCFTYSLESRRRSTASNLYSRYDEHCDCWYVSGGFDRVGEWDPSGVGQLVWFNGLKPTAPPPPPRACANGSDDDHDGKTDLADPGCASADDQNEYKPVRLSSYTARRLTRSALASQFKKRWRAGDLYEANCRRETQARVRCRTSWYYGTWLYFEGRVTISKQEDDSYTYGLRIRREHMKTGGWRLFMPSGSVERSARA